MAVASEKGWPVIRPMFFEFPCDEQCWSAKGQYMFGGDIIFAPVTSFGARSVSVYLPEGEWVLTKDGSVYNGGARYDVSVDITEFAAFVKSGSPVLACFTK